MIIKYLQCDLVVGEKEIIKEAVRGNKARVRLLLSIQNLCLVASLFLLLPFDFETQGLEQCATHDTTQPFTYGFRRTQKKDLWGSLL